MAYERQYTQGVGWENEPSVNTPISAENLNQMDMAIQDVDEAVYNAFNNIESKQRNRFRHAVMTNSGAVIALQCGTIVDAYNSVDDLHDGDILVLYVSNAISLSSGSTWKVQAYKKVDASSAVSILKELRDANGANITSSFSAGSLLFMLYDATNNYWKLQETITSNGGGGGGGSMEEYATYVYDDEIVSERHNLILAKKAWGSTTPAENAILFLRIATNSDIVYGGAAMLGWVLKYVGSSAEYNVNSMLLDFRNGKGTDLFNDTLQAGSILVLAYWSVGVHSCDDSWGVLAVIPAAGGGGGTTVIANPSGEATDDLEKLQVGNTIYDIPTAVAATLAGLTDTDITTPADYQILKYDSLISKWINAKNGANALILSTGNTDTTGYVIDINASLANIEVGDIVEIKINANYTFTGGGEYSHSWGMRFDSSQHGWEAYDVLRRVGIGLNEYFNENLKNGDSVFTVCTGFDAYSPKLLVVAVYNINSNLADLSDTTITSPADKQILRYDNATSKWINGKNSANVLVLYTGTTDVSGSTLDISQRIDNLEIGDLVEFRINANYTFSGSGITASSWGTSYNDGEYTYFYYNVLKRIPSNLSESFRENLKKGDSVLTVCAGFVDGTPSLCVIAVYNADGMALDDLNNINISTPTDGQYLKYDSASSKWVNASGGGGGHTIKDNGTAVTNRATLDFTDFDIADDSTNLETDIKAHRLTSAELSEIVSPLPSTPLTLPILFDETGAETQVGWYKLANGTKKPVYQKMYVETSPSNNTDTKIIDLPESFDVKKVDGFLLQAPNNVMPINIYYGSSSYVSTYAQYYPESGIRMVAANGQYQNKTCYITIQYTKSTDTPS